MPRARSVPTTLEMTGEDEITPDRPSPRREPGRRTAPRSTIRSSPGRLGRRSGPDRDRQRPTRRNRTPRNERTGTHRKELIEAGPPAQAEPPPVRYLQGADASRLLPPRRQEPAAGGALWDRRGPPRRRSDRRQGQGREAVPRRRAPSLRPGRRSRSSSGAGDEGQEKSASRRLRCLCALVASLAFAVAPAAAEAPDSAPVRSVSDGGLGFPEITGPEAPEEYPILMELGPEQELRQQSDTQVGIYFKEDGVLAFSVESPGAHDADGATVPTTLEKTGEDEVTLTVRFRAGNPAAGGAPFAYPIIDGAGLVGGLAELLRTHPGRNRTVRTADHRSESGGDARSRCRSSPARCRRCAATPCAARRTGCGARALRDRRGPPCQPERPPAKARSSSSSTPAGTELAAGAPVAVKLGAASR